MGISTFIPWRVNICLIYEWLTNTTRSLGLIRLADRESNRAEVMFLGSLSMLFIASQRNAFSYN